MDKIKEAIAILEDLNEDITTSRYPASRNYISDKITTVISILEEVQDAEQ